MSRRLLSVWGFAACLAVSSGAEPERLAVGNFSTDGLKGWETKTFEGETDYGIITEQGEEILHAAANDSASGLVKKQRIDLQRYPYLNWRWRIHKRLPSRDESSKAGDDYPVRIYLVVDGGLFFWKTKAVNYVWSRNMPKGSRWPNAFAGDNVMMISLRDSTDETDRWYTEKRNVLDDLREIVGPDIRYVDAVALMTDTDNTHSRAESDYGDIYFSRR